MKTLFYLQDDILKQYHISNGDYTTFLKDKKVDGYCLFDVNDLPEVWEVDADFSILTDGYDGYYSNNEGWNIFVIVDKLKPLKRTLNKMIDAQTKNSIMKGFQYDDLTFSLSIQAQAKWSGLYSARDILKYPLHVANIDDTNNYTLYNPEDVINIYETAINTIRDILDQGNNIKNQVKSAKTKRKLKNIAKKNLNMSALDTFNKLLE